MLFNSLYADLVGYVLFLCAFVVSWVFGWLWFGLEDWNDSEELPSEDNVVELVWTLVPSVLAGCLCILNLQCFSSEVYRQVNNVIKVVGHQWYWSYEYVGVGGGVVYDSLMLDFLNSVDKPLRFFYNVPVNLFVTSADVIHSFSLPALNLKVDAVPGRINFVSVCPNRLGVFVGYCSELCGAGHAFMPIVAEVVVFM